MRAQNRLIAFVARYVSVTSSRAQPLAGFSSTERTLILPGDVRYEVDLAKLQPEDVRWDAGIANAERPLPDIEIAGPEVDLNAAREYGEGGILATLTNADKALDHANRGRPSPTCASRRRPRCRCGWPAKRRGRRSSAASRCR